MKERKVIVITGAGSGFGSVAALDAHIEFERGLHIRFGNDHSGNSGVHAVEAAILGHAGKGWVKREIGDVGPALVRAELYARRKQQALDRAVTGNAVEIETNPLSTRLALRPRPVMRSHEAESSHVEPNCFAVGSYFAGPR